MRRINFMGADGWALENEALSAVVLPAHGGKVASIIYRPRGFELLFQNPKGVFRRAGRGDDFSMFEACGFDEAFPTVDACVFETAGETLSYPDHGELWSAAFEPKMDGGGILLSYHSPVLGYRYEKRFSLEGERLVCRYRIENPTGRDLPALWVCHLLVRCEPDMRLLLPPGVMQVQNVFSSDWLGQRRALLSWPLAEGPRGQVDLSRMPPDGQLKYYVRGRVRAGQCGYEYPRSGVRALLCYDPDKLPYLGFWATAGGYRGDVNCALEPANGYFDNIPTAQSFGACPVLRAGETWDFSLAVAVSEIMRE